MASIVMNDVISSGGLSRVSVFHVSVLDLKYNTMRWRWVRVTPSASSIRFEIKWNNRGIRFRPSYCYVG